MLQKLTSSTILGLTFGVLLAGYAVFAFTPPIVAPTGGNTLAPINVGAGDQTKSGGLLNVFGLWVNQSLGVSGGASFGGIVDLGGNRITNVGSPSVSGDVATRGYTDSKTSGLQTRVSSSCPAGQGVRAIGSNGSVTCEAIPVPNLTKFTTVSFSTSGAGGWGGDHDWTYKKTFNVPADAKGWACTYVTVAGYLFSGNGNIRINCGGNIIHQVSNGFFNNSSNLNATPIFTTEIGSSCDWEAKISGDSDAGGNYLTKGSCYSAGPQ